MTDTKAMMTLSMRMRKSLTYHLYSQCLLFIPIRSICSITAHKWLGFGWMCWMCWMCTVIYTVKKDTLHLRWSNPWIHLLQILQCLVPFCMTRLHLSHIRIPTALTWTLTGTVCLGMGMAGVVVLDVVKYLCLWISDCCLCSDWALGVVL